MAEADPALLVADHHERGEAEASAALDHLGHAIDVHELVDELAVALAIIASLLASSLLASCHVDSFPEVLEAQPCLAGSVCER